MKKLNIINIITDEKFIDNVIAFQDLSSNKINHSYVILKYYGKKKFKYIKQKERLLLLSPSELIKLAGNDVDGIIIHNLTSVSPKIILKLPKKIPIMWSSWGMDIYSYPDYSPIISINNLHHSLTKEKIEQYSKESFLKRLKKTIYRIITQQSITKKGRYLEYLRAITRINFFSSVIPTEYDYIKNKDYFNAKYISYKYYNPNYFNKIIPIKQKYKRIIIGNSAAPTNNHLDIFYRLKKIKLNDYEIVLPLNYGADKQWTDMILNIAKDIFGEKLHPITDFLPLESYNDILSESSHAIFFHERQQALGNIYSLLENGCKIFLSEESITYKYFKKEGYHVYSIQSELNQENIDSNLEYDKAIENNKRIHNLIRNKNNALKDLDGIYKAFLLEK